MLIYWNIIDSIFQALLYLLDHHGTDLGGHFVIVLVRICTGGGRAIPFK